MSCPLSVYPTQLHLVQGELVLLNISCHLLEGSDIECL